MKNCFSLSNIMILENIYLCNRMKIDQITYTNEVIIAKKYGINCSSYIK